MRVLAGNPADPESGVDVEVTVGSARSDGFEAPFVRVVGPVGSRKILVGQACIDKGRIAVVVDDAWSEAGGWHRDTWQGDGLGEALEHPAHRIASGSKHFVIAKAVTEGSRNSLKALRGLRYEMEEQVADLLAQRKNMALRSVMAQLVELSMAVSRARDQAREAVREAGWMRGSPAMSHCEAMEAELGDEMTRLQSLLNSMSTLAVAQEGEAQQRFNIFAAAVAAGVGLPALMLSLYGADDYLPFSWDKAWRALLPIVVTLLLAGGVILRRMPGRLTVRRCLITVGLIAGVTGMLLLAGLLAPR